MPKYLRSHFGFQTEEAVTATEFEHKSHAALPQKEPNQNNPIFLGWKIAAFVLPIKKSFSLSSRSTERAERNKTK